MRPQAKSERWIFRSTRTVILGEGAGVDAVLTARSHAQRVDRKAQPMAPPPPSPLANRTVESNGRHTDSENIAITLEKITASGSPAVPFNTESPLNNASDLTDTNSQASALFDTNKDQLNTA